MSETSFASLPLSKSLLTNLSSLNYDEMTEIQAQSLPLILNGEDVIAQGKTGSGKTAAFTLGILHRLNVKQFRIQSLVVCPTRELADQVATDIRTLARSIHNIKVMTLCGGTPLSPQAASLEHGAHIIVGTPGRLQDHLKRGSLNLQHLSVLVLDEADRMLEMGFQDEIDTIIEYAPIKRQTLLFSATYPEQIQQIAQKIMNSPKQITVKATHDNTTIDQRFYLLQTNQDRMVALRLLLNRYQPDSSVVFCNTKREVQEVTDELANRGYSAIALHGDLEQKDRDQALIRFANKSARILVATDVAARGLDIDNLSAVFNFHVAHDPEVHVHRIGRTGRAGSKGLAFTFYSNKDDQRIKLLEDILDRNISTSSLPSDELLDVTPASSEMITIRIEGGKKQKIRPGDIVGALTGKDGITGQQIGKIAVSEFWSYVAVQREHLKIAFKKLNEGKLKGKKFRVMVVRG